MRELGRIIRLQVQTDSIKSGSRLREQYTPHPNLVSVAALRLTPNGVEGVGFNGDVLPDVHNALHPRSKNRGDNGISINFTGHYRAMRERFGEHLSDGIAGENILVERDAIEPLDTVESGIVIVGVDGETAIEPWGVAHPCAPFSRFCLSSPADAPPDPRISETLRYLDNGTRGYTATFSGDEAEIRVGDIVYAVGASSSASTSASTSSTTG